MYTFLNDVNLCTWRFLGPIPACCVLQGIFGLIYSTGVFVALIDLPAYTLSVGISGFCAYLGVTLAGIAMSKLVPPEYEHQAPVYASMFGAFGMAAQLLWAHALQIRNTTLMFFAAALYGLGCGSIYGATVDVLQAWVPEARGRITSAGMLCGASGTLLGIKAFHALSVSLGSPAHAIASVGLLSAATCFAVSPLLQKPPVGWHPDDCAETERGDHARDTAADEDCRLITSSGDEASQVELRLTDILRDKSFYFLLLAFGGTAGPGFGIILAFQKMAIDMFGISLQQSNTLFFWVTCTGLAGRILAGLGVDFLHDSHEENIFMGAAKKTNKLLLGAQLVAILSMPYLVRAGMLYSFTVASALIYITFSGGPVVAACLVGGVFNQNNANLAFSLIMVSVGFGDMFFSSIVAHTSERHAVQRVLQENLLRSHANDYNLYLLFSVIWSIVGLVATHFIRQCRRLSEEDVQQFSRSVDGESALERAANLSADESFLRLQLDMLHERGSRRAENTP